MSRTIKRDLVIRGIGVHSGLENRVILHPAPQGAGISFLKKGKRISVSPNNVVDTKLSIVLEENGERVATIEHLIASVYMSGITDLLIEVEKEEIPIMDGSAIEFLKAIEDIGFEDMDVDVFEKKGRHILIDKTYYIRNGDRFVIVLPSVDENFSISYSISYDNPVLKCQNIFFQDIDFEIFKSEIAPARTFGFLEEVEKLREMGYARGGSLENAIVISKEGYVTKELRFEDECVRHKVLDLIGAIALVRVPVKGFFIANKSGHSLDVKLVEMIYNEYL